MTGPRAALTIRAARPRDVAACARVCVRAILDLSRRQGQPRPRLRARDLHPFMRHALRTDPDGFQVGVVRGQVVCYAITILRGRVLFLAQFFALPGTQSRGTGRQVLTRAFRESHAPRGAVRCLVASLDLRAQALYLKFGMQPRSVMYFVSGKPPEIAARGGLELRAVGPAGRLTPRARAIAAKFDRTLRGTRRDVDQRFFVSAVKGSRFYEARSAGRTVGYVVIRGNGAIGPGGVADPAWSEALFAAATGRAHAMGIKKVVAWIPGLNEGALRAAFAAGLKIDFLTVWMASKDIGDLRLYLPSGGVLF